MVGRLDGGMVVWNMILTHDCAGGMMMTTEDSLQYDENYEGAYEEGYDEGAYYQEDGAGAGAGAGMSALYCTAKALSQPYRPGRGLGVK